MQVDGPTTTAPETAPESPPPGAVGAPVDVFAGPGRGAEAATIGQGRARRRWGLAGQYTVLCLLALVVLVPIAFAVIQALSPPFKYVNAGKPLIIVGRGAIRSGAGDAVVRLAERIGALLATTLMAKNWLSREPYYVGISGFYGTRTAMELFQEADCVIGVGASLIASCNNGRSGAASSL